MLADKDECLELLRENITLRDTQLGILISVRILIPIPIHERAVLIHLGMSRSIHLYAT